MLITHSGFWEQVCVCERERVCCVFRPAFRCLLICLQRPVKLQLECNLLLVWWELVMGVIQLSGTGFWLPSKLLCKYWLDLTYINQKDKIEHLPGILSASGCHPALKSLLQVTKNKLFKSFLLFSSERSKNGFSRQKVWKCKKKVFRPTFRLLALETGQNTQQKRERERDYNWRNRVTNTECSSSVV